MSSSKAQSLEAKLCYLTISLVFVIVLGLGHLSLSQQKRLIQQQQNARYEALTQALAVAVPPALASGDRAMPEMLCQRIRTSDPDLEYVVVYRDDGHIVFADYEHGGSALKRMLAEDLPARKFISQIERASDTTPGKVFALSVPVRLAGGQQGRLAAGFSLRAVAATSSGLRQMLFVWFASALIVGILGALLVARTVTTQISALTEGACRVMSGDLTVQVPVRSSDDVGVLTSTFNRLVQQIRDDQRQLLQRANTDSLTVLYNHRFFQERLSEEIKRAERHRREVSLLMLDIDHFKTFNDEQGHPNGDTALKEVSSILRQCVRDIDVVGRYGGEEFAVILPECSIDDAFDSAERIRLAVQRHCFYGKHDEPVPLTVSLGVANYPCHSQEREGLIFAADVALYQSKSLGRNKVTIYDGAEVEADGDAPYQFYVALHATDISTIESLAEAIDAKHNHPDGFSHTVAETAVRIGRHLGLPREDQESLRLASLLRDIGQIGVSSAILNKEGPLTPEERRMLESHPSLGYAVVERSPHFRAMLPGILHHHERWDGKGYPFGLAGEDIPLVARVIAVADAYRAMTADRPHRQSLPPDQARAEMLRCASTQFDPRIVQALLDVEAGQDREVAEAA